MDASSAGVVKEAVAISNQSLRTRIETPKAEEALLHV